jgi:hypothetical protein
MITGSETIDAAAHTLARNRPCDVTKLVRYTGAVPAITLVDVVDTSGTLTLRHNGRLHHIGVGRTHARTPILMLINGLHIRIIHATTGEFNRELILNPNLNYEAPRPPQPNAHARLRVQGVAYVLRHHTAEDAGFEPARG